MFILKMLFFTHQFKITIMSCIISEESIVVCGEIKTGGIQQVIAVYNLADWKSATVSQVDADSAITDIVNAVGLKALKVESYDETGIIPECTLREIEGNIDLLDHKVKMPIIQNTQPVRSSFLKTRSAPDVISSEFRASIRI